MSFHNVWRHFSPEIHKTFILELITESDLHGSVVIIGGEYRCGPLIRLHRYVEYDPGFVRGDPSPFEPVFLYPEGLTQVEPI